MGGVRRLLLSACAMACALIGAAAEAREGRWLRAESQNFIVYGDAGEARLREATESLEIFDQLLRALLGRATAEGPKSKLEVYLVRSSGDLRRVRPKLGSGTLGFYIPDAEIVASFAVFRDRYGIDGQEVLFHEYAHHFMYQHAGSAYPGWFIEGYAEFVQTAEIEAERVLVGRFTDARAITLMQYPWISMEDLLVGDRARMSQQQVWAYYAQSWLLTHHILNTPNRKQAFADYVMALRGGADPIAAFEPAFGLSPEAFSRELRSYSRGNLGMIVWNHGPIAPSDISVTRLPEAADDLLLLDVRMRFHVSAEDRDAFLERVRTIAARFPGDAYATRVLANAELVAGRPQGARDLLAPLIEADPQDWQALYLAGLSYIVEANAASAEADDAIAAQARRYFSRVFRINSTHVPTQYFYARSYLYGSNRLPESALDVLVNAHLLWPQVSEIGLLAGAQLMLAERFDEAESLIGLYASSPHETASTRRARRMLDAARRREAPPAPGDDDAGEDEDEES